MKSENMTQGMTLNQGGFSPDTCIGFLRVRGRTISTGITEPEVQGPMPLPTVMEFTLEERDEG